MRFNDSTDPWASYGLMTVVVYSLLALFLAVGCADTAADGGNDEGTVTDRGARRVGDDTGTDGGITVDSSTPTDMGSTTVDTGAEITVADTSTEASSGPDTAGCETEGFFLKPDPANLANIMLVVDRSNSMNDDTRWADMTGALRTVTRALESYVAFGLVLFPSPSGGLLAVCATGSVEVPVGLGAATATAISNELGAFTSTPSGGTPTALSLLAARDSLAETNPGGRNYVLLATDGGPGCNTSLDLATCDCIPGASCVTNENCLDDVRTLETVETLYDEGIPTYVIGVPGSETVSDLLDQMAIAGGTDVDGHHYAVTGETELANALRETTGSLVPCDYTFSIPPSDIDSLTVTIDGAEIPRDPSGTDGWDFVDGVLHLYGSACSRIRDGGSHAVDASFDCEE